MKINSAPIFYELILKSDETDDFLNVTNLFLKKYDLNQQQLNLKQTFQLSSYIEEVIENKISEEVDWLREDISDISEVEDKKYELEEIESDLQDLLEFHISPDFSAFDDLDWHDIIVENHLSRMAEKYK